MFRVVPVYLHFGKSVVDTLAFLDEGASVTLIEKTLAKKIALIGEREQLTIRWTADISRTEKDSLRADIQISPKGDNKRWLLRDVRTVSQLRLPVQHLCSDNLKEQYPLLKEIPVQSYREARPGILIGLNNLDVIAPLETKIGNIGDPIGVRSKLGWSIYGPIKHTPASGPSEYVEIHEEPTNQEIHDLIKFQYAVEESAVAMATESKDNQRAREILEKTTVRIGDRFETGLLWSKCDVWFPESYGMAFGRMQQLERRLAKTPELHKTVCKQIEEYLQKGYAHEITSDELVKTDIHKTWYLPLNVVLNPKKPGKVRLVWDAAATVNGISLNTQLLKGPDMMVSLPAVICRFRERPVAFGADIREMYHQIRIRAEDKQAQRFLFRKDTSKPPTIYVMDVATFGAACSPCSAQFIKNRNANEFATDYPEAANAILYNHYFDDYYHSTDTPEEAIQLATEVRYVHSKGGFDIRNWVSNSKTVLAGIGEPETDCNIHFNRNKETDNERVLGIVWNPHDDVFSFSTAHRENMQCYLTGESRPTKRIVLSCVMGFFDPLGLLSPFTIHGRILIQDLWRSGCEWDDPVDDDSLAKWKRWTSVLHEVENLRIERCYLGNLRSNEIQILEIHVFTDASEHAYGCAAYFRIHWAGGIKVSLVMSSVKVAPLKRVSVPRLELMAAVRGAKIMTIVKKNHSLNATRCFLWTDSQTVLSWITSEARNYQQFVSFRIAGIQELTNVSDWRWVPTKLNIADVLTKWNSCSPLDSNGPWFRGPAFLYDLENHWPEQIRQPINTTEEIKQCFLSLHETVPENSVIDVGKYSTWNRSLRIVATIYRFICNLKRKKNGEPILCSKAEGLQEKLLLKKINCEICPLDCDELKRAEIILWKQAQHDSFPEELHTLQQVLEERKNSLKYRLRKSSKLYKLSPMLDNEGVLRVNGRTERAEYLPFDQRFPIILPRGHVITLRLLQQYHERFGHANRETVFNEVNQKFCIPGLRRAIRLVAKDCMWCKVHRCVPHVPLMSPLPIQRITPQLGPFQAVGVDYLGPLGITVGRRVEKRWVAVFTCLSVRAIHLEVVYSLSTQSCLMAIRRFMCRQGTPQEFFSDNGTNFTGAWNEMCKQVNYNCAEAIVSSRTKWHFNPPGTPHMGGIWERMVRSVKEAMKALNDGRKLTDEILWTTLSEVQEMINLRPLTYKPQDDSCEEALTPNHFLRTVKAEDFQPTTETELADALKSIFHRAQFLADKMWQRWIKEYLPSINQRTKWFQEIRKLQKNDLVFVVTGKDRKQWVRGIVEEVLEGQDGKVRQALIRTGNGVNRRSVVNLAVLELGAGSKTVQATDLKELRVGGVDVTHSSRASHDCSFTVVPPDATICQLRIDFTAFSISQPDANGVCAIDNIQVSGGASSVPVICGDNNGQHVYVTFSGTNPIYINVMTTASTSFQRIWNLQLSLISCTSAFKAPAGCLQYFLSSSGEVASLNYGSSANPALNALGMTGTRQLANQNYGICIAAAAGMCSITYTLPTGDSFAFTMTNDATAVAAATLGTGAVGAQGVACTTDYLIIPNPTGINNDRFCGLGLDPITSNTIPFNLYYITNANDQGDVANRGFRLGPVMKKNHNWNFNKLHPANTPVLSLMKVA
ncbi:uncharacterized protein LOC129752812 [Uranotaenia lowii]|uniref:uncharacterized protein LOC129752812 n=1 Tax=Uranotaenia lowii TaxID=190385 RepID=UPI00247A51F1|nr:uncharacterized protein LOC129752812 [Uranotaenia lowii]